MKNKLQKAQNILRKTKNILIISAMILSIASGNAFAAADPLGAINNLSTFIFSAIKTIGAEDYAGNYGVIGKMSVKKEFIALDIFLCVCLSVNNFCFVN